MGNPKEPGPKGFGSCKDPDYADAGRASAQDIEAVITCMRRQAYVDANRIVLIGHSAGGWGSLAAASKSPPGVVAAVLFAPRRGSPAPDEVCDGNALVTAAGLFGKTTQVPTLWIYSDNDYYFSPKLARDVYDAFRATTHGAAEFIEDPSCLNDGHMLVRNCPEIWQTSVAAFLQKTVTQPLAEEFVLVETPDWGPADLSTLPYKRVRQGVFPIT